MSPADKAQKIVFISVPGDISSVPQRDRELQAALARAHAARVSRRPTQKAGAVKHEPARPSRTEVSAILGVPGALALRTAPKPQRRRARRTEEHHDTHLDQRALSAVSASSLGQGQVDPFDSAPVKGLDNFIYSILDFAYDYAFPSFVPAAPTTALPTHRASRRHLGRQFEFLLEAQIVAAARFQMSPMISLTEDQRKRIQAINEVHEKRAVELINREVQTLTTLPADALIYASALLAYVSGPNYDWESTGHPISPLATAQNLHAMGHLAIAPERVQAVRTLVQLRGGIDELSMPFQRIVLTYLDTIVSTRLGIRPGWAWPTAIPESLQQTGEHILDHTATRLMSIMGSGFSEMQHEGMHQTLLLMCEATIALDHCHRGGSSSPMIWDVARVRVAVQHRLCSFDPASLDDANLADVQFELCRLSALLYSDLVLFPIPDHAGVRPRLLYDLGRALDKYEEVGQISLSGAEPNLLAWSVLLAAAASTTNTVFSAQYAKRLEDLVRADRRLRSWELYQELVSRYLWWDYLLDSLAWEAFSAVPWRDIYAQDEGLALDRAQSHSIQASRPQVFSWRSTSSLEQSLRAIP